MSVGRDGELTVPEMNEAKVFIFLMKKKKESVSGSMVRKILFFFFLMQDCSLLQLSSRQTNYCGCGHTFQTFFFVSNVIELRDLQVKQTNFQGANFYKSHIKF